jgi:uncharacterized repeat protein (TIGR03806 family)
MIPMTRLVFIVAACVAAIALIRSTPAADHPVPPPLMQRPPTAFECRFAETPIVIDGAADDDAWKNAETVEAFHLPWLGDQARLARTSTKARLLWDREYLFFFADMEDSDLFADVKDHDGTTWNNDVFELFFRPDRAKPGYYEFQVNALGTKFDCYFPQRASIDFEKQKKLGAFHIEAKVKLRGTLNQRDDADRGWSVEGRIPWTDFLRTGGRPEPGEQWGLNLCRYDYHKDWKEPELSCIAPISKPDFHQLENYAAVTFVGPKPIGLARRDPLTTSTVIGFPDPPPPYRVVRAIGEYRPDFPVMVKPIPGSDRLLVITQPRAYAPTRMETIADPAATGKKAGEPIPFLDTPGGGTAYDFTFHPKFAENGYVYIGWNGIQGWLNPRKRCFVTRYTMQARPPYAVDPGSAVTIISWESNGHNGAAVTFGLDGMLYVTSGDGTSDSDANVTGQRTDLLLAKLLRIDVDHIAPSPEASPSRLARYSIPKDNPFVGDTRFVPETWAYGLRNPWRICTDAKTGHIWVGQNGQDLWESAMLIKKGANYGWSVMEGSHPFYLERKAGPTPIVKPTVEHHHSEARSLTGGIVYYGARFPELQGAYIYGDYSTGHIWAVKHDGDTIVWHKKIAITPLKITAFSTDHRGELLICDHTKAGEGGFYTFEPNPAPKESSFPKTLSASGLFDTVKGHKVKPSLMPYSVNAPFWSDSMHKERFVAVPAGQGITFTRGAWGFPDQTVLVKSFALDTTEGNPSTRTWVETRFLTKQGGEWYGYSYLWNDTGTEAALVDAAGADKTFTVRTATGERQQVWHYPGRAECMVCHSRAANYVLGLTEMQMNKDHDYGNSKLENQIRAFERLGMFRTDWFNEVRGRVSDPINKPEPGQRPVKPSTLFTGFPTKLAKMADPYDKAQDINSRAKAWLHVNCATCHVDAGGGNALMQLDFNTPLDKMRILNVNPVHQTFNISNGKLLAPGDPERSVLLHRMSRRGPNTGQMPPLSTNRVDEAGLELMRDWCRQLKK